MTREGGRLAVAVLLLVGVVGLEGSTAESSEEVRTLRSATGELSAVLLRPEAEQAFEREGHPVAGSLSCSSAEDGTDRLTVVCSGTSAEGGELRFRGRVDPATVAGQPGAAEGLPGAYTGTAAGEQVFRMNCFNCEPREPEEETGPSAGAGSTA
ncbi:hypothetical protein [Streptomonospora litoralis]|uniref:Uncharacterized protein n=1 Tax=Streptomonospora litoralis TaxID=2498135 RepID=A0A4P6Q603_9ACTN|nr:hypothetical protein [Streptomonospora litoralis]QBI54207.1 hypothetical protein EKD16_12120 [Streptomonospora litoralis]